MAHGFHPDRTTSTMKVAIKATDAPAPVGPYSQAIRAGDLVFVSGQDPIDPRTGAEPDEFTARVCAALANLDNILRAAGSHRENILKVTIYLADLTRFDDLNEAYADFFANTVPPARTTIGVPHLHHALEMDCIATVVNAHTARP